MLNQAISSNIGEAKIDTELSAVKRVIVIQILEEILRLKIRLKGIIESKFRPNLFGV